MQSILKRLLALNLALLMLFTLIFPASAAQTGPAPGTHTLTIDDKTYSIGNSVESGSGWNAYAILNGDKAPLLVLELHDYTGGPIAISNPTGTGTVENVYVLLRFYGTNTITNESGPAITVSGGYSALSIVSNETTDSCTITGQPAVQTDCTLSLRAPNITLDGRSGPAYESGSFRFDESQCSLTETKTGDLITRVTTAAPTPVTITVYRDANKSDPQKFTVKKGTPVDLSNLFTEKNKYVAYYQDTNGGGYWVRVYPDHDMELIAVWKPCGPEYPAVFYTLGDDGTGDKIVDAAQENWVVPAGENYTRNGQQNTFLCWEHQTEDGHAYLLPDQTQQPLTSGVGYYGRYTRMQTGVVYFSNGEVFSNGEAVMERTSSTTTFWNAQSGKVMTGWNTQPDGSGTSYAAYGEEIPAASSSLVRLYAQWEAAENSVRVGLYANTTGYENVTWLPRGGQFTLPELGAMFGCEQPYWDVIFFYTDGTNDRKDSLPSGVTVTIPQNATECYAHAYWIPAEPLVIGGQSYTITRNQTRFSGNGWWANYNLYQGVLTVELYGYQGPELSLPASAQLRLQSGSSTITAAAGKYAISCGGWLDIRTECSDSSHPSLTATGAAGLPAVRADRLIAYRAPHVKFIAGDGGTVFGSDTTFELDESACAYSGILTDQTKVDKLNPNAMPDDLSSLSILPRTYTLTVNGGGSAKTADGSTQATKPVEAGQTTSYASLGFTNPGCWCYGYSPSNTILGNNYEVVVPNGDCEIQLHWAETGYNSFLAFRVDDALQEEPAAAHSWKSSQSTVLFVDYKYSVATAPDLKYAEASCGDLLYWYTEEGKMYETEDSQQLLPNEFFKKAETGIKSGTTLRAVPEGAYWHAFFANGKLFDDGSKHGKKVIPWNNSNAVSWNATDGAQLLCWNTRADGTGTQYKPGDRIPDDVMRLYAQWAEAGTIPVTMYNETGGGRVIQMAKPGTSFVLPEPNETAIGLRFTQWRCYYYDQNDRYHALGTYPAGKSIPITQGMKELRAIANWLPTGKLIVDGDEYTIDQDHLYVETRDWVASFDTMQGSIALTLQNYDGGGISFPCAAAVYVDGEKNTINGTLRCEGALRLIENCEFGEHPSLTVTATDPDMPAIMTRMLSFGRVPHLTLTGGANSRVLISPDDQPATKIDYYNACYYGKTSSSAEEILVIEDKVGKRVGDMWQLRTEPVMCTVTIDGSGGTVNGEETVTRQIERNEVYSLRSLGFKKPNADLTGVEESGDGQFDKWSEQVIRPYADAFTIHLRWRDIGYPYIAFRSTSRMLTGTGVPANTDVVYYHNSGTLTVPELHYQSTASGGDLVYWFTSENGQETADSHFYLPGETVQEPDDTTLYAGSIRPGEVVLVATGTRFYGGNRLTCTSACFALRAADGREAVSWNTEPDGSGKSYANLTSAFDIGSSPRVLYAQWGPAFTASANTDAATGETTIEIQPSTDLVEKPENTTNTDGDTGTDDTPITEGIRVILAAYQNGRFAGMVFGVARNGVIYCKLPSWLRGQSCVLKLFFMEGGKPSRPMEIIQIQ